MNQRRRRRFSTSRLSCLAIEGNESTWRSKRRVLTNLIRLVADPSAGIIEAGYAVGFSTAFYDSLIKRYYGKWWNVRRHDWMQVHRRRLPYASYRFFCMLLSSVITLSTTKDWDGQQEHSLLRAGDKFSSASNTAFKLDCIFPCRKKRVTSSCLKLPECCPRS